MLISYGEKSAEWNAVRGRLSFLVLVSLERRGDNRDRPTNLLLVLAFFVFSHLFPVSFSFLPPYSLLLRSTTHTHYIPINSTQPILHPYTLHYLHTLDTYLQNTFTLAYNTLFCHTTKTTHGPTTKGSSYMGPAPGHPLAKGYL